MKNEKVTIQTLLEMKAKGEKITMFPAYDYPMASLLDRANADIIIIGDSLAMVILGHDHTISGTMEEMIHHCQPVVKACKRAMVVGDMPFGSYQISEEQAVQNAIRFMKEGGVEAIKLEGGGGVAGVTKAIVKAGVPVIGHIGLTPQTVFQIGGYKVQGKSASIAKNIIEDALALEEAGAFAIVMECIPAPVSRIITQRLKIPTIGIGAGIDCDGQTLITYDILGLFDRFIPKFVKRYANLSPTIVEALQNCIKEIQEGKFPETKHSFTMNEDELKILKETFLKE